MGASGTAKNLLAALIRGLPAARGPLTGLSNQARRLFHWETVYVEAGISAEVNVLTTLETEMGRARVEIDPLDLPPTTSEVIVMNEQGAHPFDRYRDSSGISLNGEEIGCWDAVSAGEAWFESSARKVRFGLTRVEGARLFRGRELVGSRLAWAGFGCSFPPENKKWVYEMKIERLA